ncbi:TRAP transporter permease [Gelria sp. Kuro-4]|uniref:TRAP transporter permease n=1 Tax=Gelria sp. Kuro-4 TaxID=2796927 RepID=UPI001BF01ACF|nr:TRAP transporter permease [Gelria sp. Kuro-4]BCV26013.1 C4-dicarboxylate ABC transporter [Gelria sp. Kuro-4]
MPMPFLKSRKPKPAAAQKPARKRRKLTGRLAVLVSLLAVTMSIFQLYTAAAGLLPPLQQRSIHLLFVLALVFLLYPATPKSPLDRPSALDWFLMVVAVAGNLYPYLRYVSLAKSGGIYIASDYVFGALTILLVFEAARRVVGWPLVILAGLCLVYAFIGPWIPGPLGHSGFTLTRVIEQMYLTTEGVYGQILGVSATYIFLFVLFGAFLSVTGVSAFFNDLATALAGRTRGGPAKVAVISSALMGTVSGSTSANVVTTGTFTIPLMKKTGYQPYFAGAVEAAASCGGQIMPPIMGSAAYIMADTLGVSYLKIMAAAFVPAVLYFLSVGSGVHWRAWRLGIAGIKETPSLLKVLRERGYLFLPLVAIIYLLVSGYNALYAAFWGIIVTMITSFVRRESRINLRRLLEALQGGALSALSVAMACAIVGVVIGVFTLTGAVLTMAGAVMKLSGGILPLTMLLTMIVAMLMGMGVPTTACYVLTSAVAAPALVQMGVEPLAAHMFVFYYGCLATITPPVAVGAYTAAGLAGSDPNETGWQAVKLAGAGFLVPFIFVYSPVLLMINATPWSIAQAAVTGSIGVIALSIAFEGFYHAPLSVLERFWLLAAALLLVVPGTFTDLMGLGLVAAFYVLERRREVQRAHLETVA